MSWDEALFGFFYRAWQRGRRGLDRRSPDEIARTVVVADRHAHLRLFATALSGAPVELIEGEGDGGTRGAVISLPREVGFASSRDANGDALLLRTAYSAYSLRLGFQWSGDPQDRALATLLAAPATLAALEHALPRTRELRAALTASVMSTRPPIARLAPGAQRLEALGQLLLGREAADVAREAPLASAWATDALALGPASPSTLADAVSRVGPARGDVAPIVLWGSLFAAPSGGDAPPAKPGELGQAGVRTERRARAHDDVRRATLKADEPRAENPVIHSFEKLHTAETHAGGEKRADGADELEEHAEALDELELREVVRSTEQARSLYRADVVLEGGADVDVEGEDSATARYDEWQDRTRSYLRGWCSVRASHAPDASDRALANRRVAAIEAKYRRQIDALRGELEQIDRARRWRTRQSDGPEVDVDALVDLHATQKSGRSGPEKLYVSRRRHHPDVATLVLLDTSLSTDAWVDGRRVIDVAREAIVILGAALRDVEIDAGLATFSSNTRRHCRFTTLKGFDTDWASAQRRLTVVEPAGYTRIGPALRHGATLLGGRDARRKLLLLVSDGKPSDYDRYEGRHGVADVRQAIREATRRGIETFALAIDGEARFHLPRMFGQRGYGIMKRPEALGRAMARVYQEVLR